MHYAESTLFALGGVMSSELVTELTMAETAQRFFVGEICPEAAGHSGSLPLRVQNEATLVISPANKNPGSGIQPCVSQ
jgi:hypothetical protein